MIEIGLVLTALSVLLGFGKMCGVAPIRWAHVALPMAGAAVILVLAFGAFVTMLVTLKGAAASVF